MKRITQYTAVFIAAGFFVSVSAPAAELFSRHHAAAGAGQGCMPPAAMRDSVHENLVFPMEIVHHQDELDLSPDQREFIKNEIKESLSEMAGLNWDLQEAFQKLEEEIKKEAVDVKQAEEQLDRVLELENAIKKNRFLLMVRIKNKLTGEQLRKIQEIKEAGPDRPGKPRRPNKGPGRSRQDGPQKKIPAE